MTFKYFKNVSDLEGLRKQYAELLKKYHPDNGGTNEQAAEVIAEYKKIFNLLKSGAFKAAGSDEKTRKHAESMYNWKADEAIRAAIEKIIHLKDITIEVCGCWVWVSGQTFPVKDILKESGYRYSKNKKAWYFTTDVCRNRKKAYTMEQIRAAYGSTKVNLKSVELLEA